MFPLVILSAEPPVPADWLRCKVAPLYPVEVGRGAPPIPMLPTESIRTLSILPVEPSFGAI